MFGIIGPSADRTLFSEVVVKHLKLYKLQNGVSLSPTAAATWARNVMATALRKGPYQVDSLIAGWDKEKGEAELFFMDAYSSLAKVNKAAHR